MLAWARRKRGEDYRDKFRRYYFADVPVDLEAIGEYRAEAFPRSGPDCWLDAPNALIEIERRENAGELSKEDAAMAEHWTLEGFYIARGLVEHDLLDKVWGAYEKAIADGVMSPPPEPHGPDDKWPGRILDPHLTLPVVREIQQHPAILHICDVLLGRKTVPFQTIIGHKGSGQSAHDDSIHMTTYPDGFLIANWIAFEDIHPDSGPLQYFPRSHRLVPPLLSADLGIAEFGYKSDPGVYNRVYEPTIAKYVEKLGLQPEHLMAKKGDVLFWHAHLLHGGAARNNLALSRKALVCHYFAEGSFTYHDLAGNPSRLHKNGVFAPPSIDNRVS
jgi:Phytanoyl-CoA dioxygenase (PhyH)